MILLQNITALLKVPMINLTSALLDPENDYFELNSTSNAINSYANYDSGAIEYYTQTGTFSTALISSSIDRYYKVTLV